MIEGRWSGILVCVALISAGAMAQTVSRGTPGTIPVFTGRSSLGDSMMTQAGNQIGIGTQTNNLLKLGGPTDSTLQDPLLVQSNYLDGGGIGMIGTVVPAEDNYAFAESDYWLNNDNAPTPNQFLWAVGSEGYYSDSGELAGADMYIFDPRRFIYNLAVDGEDNVYIGGYGFGTPTVALYAAVDGKVGIGTTKPSESLEVTGNILMTAGTGAALIFPDGTKQTTAFTGIQPALRGGDFAESVDVTGERAKYGPGDVLVIDPNSPGKFQKSAEPYATSVSGIYSTRPGTVGRRQLTAQSADEVPMAMTGIVPTNVTAQNGPIHPGDLLVTSSTLGYAMKGTQRSRMLGAVIGKALGSLDSGKGVIEVVVTLQ
jgi:hypothetical protein